MLLRFIEKSDLKKWFFGIGLALIVTDVMMFLNIPILKPLFTFIFFTTVPGFLILQILRLNKIEFLKKFVLSVGLSVAFLMFFGLFMNWFYPVIGVTKPLSTQSIIISLNIALVVLCIIVVYKRNKYNFNINDIFNFKINIRKDQCIAPMLFPILFPFLAIFGTYFMNVQENNTILMMMLVLIPIYVVAVTYLKDKVPKITYPIAILMISSSLLLMVGLRGNYIAADMDSVYQFCFFMMTANNFSWDISRYYHSYHAMLSITILPTMYYYLLNINAEYIFKVFFPLIASITPLGIYLISKKYLNDKGAFLSAVFFISHTSFIYRGPLYEVRQEIAILFFVLAMIIFFDKKLSELNSKILFLIFACSIIVSHYTTTYLFFIFMLLLCLILFSKQSERMSTTFVVLYFVAIFFWYSQITIRPFDSVIGFSQKTLQNILNIFLITIRDPSAYECFGIGYNTIPERIYVITRYITVFFISIGFLSLVKNRNKYGIKYVVAAMICLGVIAAMIVLPMTTKFYGVDRLYLQTVVILAPLFVLGGVVISRKLRIKSSDSIVTIILVIWFLCSSGFIYGAFGEPYHRTPMVLNSINSYTYDGRYMHESDVACAKWLLNSKGESPIHTDFSGKYIIYFINEKITGQKDILMISKSDRRHDLYVYLRNTNTKKGLIFYYSRYNSTVTLHNYSYIFEGDKIYVGGGAEVLYIP